MLLLTLFCLLQSAVIDCQMDKDGSASYIDQAVDIASELHRSLFFDPPQLDFGAWSVGTAKSQVVTLVNRNENSSVYLRSVTGRTSDFYSSFFQHKVIPPQGNTTFNVVFLPRSNGEVETNLLVHTSFGQAKLLVRGEGRECPYRLRPLVGIRAPLNSSLSPEIHMYNPHPRSLQVKEIYSSGGQFKLELPDGGTQGSKEQWEIPPHSTKPIIRIRFDGANPGNHTAYIRIKIAQVEDGNVGGENVGSNMLVIPVEFEIFTTYGIYSPKPVYDFGRLTAQDTVHTFKVELKNSGKSKVDIIDYQLRNIEFPISINRNTSELSLNPSAFMENAFINGSLVIRSASKETPTEIAELVLFIRAEVYTGTLRYDKNVTMFITKSWNFSSPQRDFYVLNTFSLPVTVMNVTSEGNGSSAYMLTPFTPITIKPGQEYSIFKIILLDRMANIESSLTILTNMTTFRVPVIVCTGLFDFYTLNTDDIDDMSSSPVLDLGTVPFGATSHSGYIIVRNPNPITMEVPSWDFSSAQGVYFHTTFLGCVKRKEAKEDAKRPLHESKFKWCFKLEKDDLSVYDVAIQSYQAKALTSSFKFITEYGVVVIAVKFDTIMGRLEVDQSKLHFENCFPGKLCSAEISFHSTFAKPMRVNSIVFSDSGLQFEDNEKDGTWIMPNVVTNVGKIYFDPRSLCQARCYIPLNQTLSPLKKKSLETYLNFDEAELRKRIEVYRHFKYYLKTITFTVDTSEVRLFKFNLTVDIVWPKLVNGIQTIPTIEIDMLYPAQIVLHNPSDTPLLVDFFISNHLVAKSTKLSLPLEVIEICPRCYLTDKDVFALIGLHKPHIIQPRSSHVATIEFFPKTPGVFSTIMHIRNNLTLYEAVWVTAKAVRSQFKFGDLKPRSPFPLEFRFDEQHVSSCLHSNIQDSAVAVMRESKSFLAQNTGDLPIIVETFMIDDEYCEGYGFKVKDCQGFELKSNSSKMINIEFTPDFTMSEVERPLIIKTNLSYLVNYTLKATLPRPVLQFCSKTLQRPPWENKIKQIAMLMLAMSFISVIVIAHLDTEKMLKALSRYMSRDRGPVQPTLNLRNIAMQPSTYDDVPANDNSRHSRMPGGRYGNGVHYRKRSNKKNFQMSTAPMHDDAYYDRYWVMELAKLGVRCSEFLDIPEPAENRSPTVNRSPSDKQKSKSSPKEVEKTAVTQSPTPDTSIEKEKHSPPKANGKTESNHQAGQSEAKKATNKNAKKAKAAYNQAQTTPEAAPASSLTATTAKESNDPKPVEDRPTPVKRTKSPKTTNKTDPIVKKHEPIIMKQQTTPEMLPSNNSDSSSGSRSTNGNSTPVTFIGKKYGKTPGRERKKEQTNGNNHQSKRFERKTSKFKPNSFHFSAPLSINNAAISVWDPSQQASFSDVVAAARTTSNPTEITPMGFEEQLSEYFPMENGSEWNDADLKNDETFGDNMMSPSLLEDDSDSIFNLGSNELGPIGTKRSPSSTPSTFANLDVLKPTVCNNSSFFSNVMPSYMYRDANQYLGRNQANYDHDYSPGHLQNQWNPGNEYFTSQSQQHSDSQKNSDPTWSMSGINGSDNTTSATMQQWYLSGFKQPSNTPVSSASSPWQRVGNIRPPPGLEYTKRDSPVNNMQEQLSPPGFGQQQQHQEQDQPFNPIFSPLSAIWSDNWNKNKTNSNNSNK